MHIVCLIPSASILRIKTWNLSSISSSAFESGLFYLLVLTFNMSTTQNTKIIVTWIHSKFDWAFWSDDKAFRLFFTNILQDIYIPNFQFDITIFHVNLAVGFESKTATKCLPICGCLCGKKTWHELVDITRFEICQTYNLRDNSKSH